MREPATAATHLLERAGITMNFEKTSVQNAPYLDGLGFACPYHVRFECEENRVEVTALITNEHVPPTANQILIALSTELEALEGAESFERWCRASDLTPYDARKVQEGDQYYLVKRYRYLSTLQQALRSIFFDEHFVLVSEFFFRYLMNDWPW